jgi:hypothetical protein
MPHHINQNQEIISSRDATDRKYWPIEFTLADGRKVINRWSKDFWFAF